MKRRVTRSGGMFMNDGRSCLHHRHRSLAIGLSCKRFNYYYEMCYTYMLGLESFPHLATVIYMNRLVYSIISISNAILHGIYPLTSSHYERVQCFDWREAIVLHCSHQSILFIGHPKRLGSSCCCQSTSESSIRCQFELIEFVSNWFPLNWLMNGSQFVPNATILVYELMICSNSLFYDGNNRCHHFDYELINRKFKTQLSIINQELDLNLVLIIKFEWGNK